MNCNRIKSRISNNKGMTLVEMIVAIGLMALIIGVFSPFMLNSFNMIRLSGDNYSDLIEARSVMEKNIAQEEVSTYLEIPVKFDDEETARASAIGWIVNEEPLSTFVPNNAYISNGPFVLSEGYSADEGSNRLITVLGNGTHFSNGVTTYTLKDVDGVTVSGSYSSYPSVSHSEKATLQVPAGINGLTTDGAPYTITIRTEGVYTTSGGEQRPEVVEAKITVQMANVIAGGEDGLIYTSYRGESWGKIDIGDSSFTMNEMIYGNDEYMAVGESGKIYIKTDDSGWVSESSSTSYNINSVVWGDGRYVAVCDSGRIITRTETGNWSFATLSSSTSRNFNTVIYDYSGEYVVAGDNGTVYHSTNGTYWSRENLSDSEDIYAGYWDGERYCLVGQYDDLWWGFEAIEIHYSSNGTSWSSDNVSYGYYNSEHDLKGIIETDDIYIAVGTEGIIFTASSITGTWTERTSGTSEDLNDVGWSGDRFVAVGDNGTIIQSEDGITWKDATGSFESGSINTVTGR